MKGFRAAAMKALDRLGPLEAELGLAAGATARLRAAFEAQAEAPIPDPPGKPPLIIPGLRSAQYWPASEVPLARELEAHADAILGEYHRLHDDDELRRYTDDALVERGTWGQFHLRLASDVIEENAAKCPITSRVVLGGGPYVGLCYFSIHLPQTRVKPHYGPGNYRLRLHLGLEIPELCGMRVGGVARRWAERECLVFDDSFHHEVWNDGPTPRAILLTDIWHPDLTAAEITAIHALMTRGDDARQYLFRRLAATGQPRLGLGRP